jgi:hypothetical protein
MTVMEMAAPFVGAIALEAVHWYQLRERLHLPKYRRMMRSVAYWAPTLVMIVVGGAGTLIYFQGRLTQGELFIAGAAFPTLFKKLIKSFVTDQVKLGGPAASESPAAPADESALSTYLSA